jgi:HEAT repeat protein
MRSFTNLGWPFNFTLCLATVTVCGLFNVPHVYCAVAPGGGGVNKEREKTITELVTTAKSNTKDPEERKKAINSLGSITAEQEQDNRVVDELLDLAVKQGDPRLRAEAIRTLGTIQLNVTKDNKAKTKYLAPFVVMLNKNDEVPFVRKAVAAVFKETLDPAGLPDKNNAYKALFEIAKNKDDSNMGLRGECIEAVGRFGAIESLEMLSGILNETEPLIKNKAVEAISSVLNNPAAGEKVSLPTVNKLIDMLSDKNIPVDLKVDTTKTVAQLVRNKAPGARNALSAIVDLIEKPSPNLEPADRDKVVIGAIKALGVIGSGEAVATLKKAYDEFKSDKEKPENSSARQAAIKSLGSILSMLQSGSSRVEGKALDDIVSTLVKGLEDENGEVKASAVYALGNLTKFEAKQKEALDGLIFLLRDVKDGNANLKTQIIESLELITNEDRGSDWKNWDAWFSKKYGVKRMTP